MQLPQVCRTLAGVPIKRTEGCVGDQRHSIVDAGDSLRRTSPDSSHHHDLLRLAWQ